MSKINKLGKSTFVIAILSFILVAVLAFGGTYAYFSDKVAPVTSGEITLGTLKITTDVNQTLVDGILAADVENIVPGAPVFDGDLTVEVDSNITYFIRAKFDVNVTYASGHSKIDADAQTALECDSDCADIDEDELIVYGADAMDGWTKHTDGYWYKVAVQPAEDGTFTIGTNGATINPDAGQVGLDHYMGATLTVTFAVEVCQSEYITTYANAQTPTIAEIAAAFTAAQTAA